MKWFHRTCVDMLVRHWNFFDKEKDFNWFCRDCRQGKDFEKLCQKELPPLPGTDRKKQVDRLQAIYDMLNREPSQNKDFKTIVEVQTDLKIT